ncbi:PIF1-like helicase-domain-containing protein, partial [Catenaria anguillulae PL171]
MASLLDFTSVCGGLVDSVTGCYVGPRPSVPVRQLVISDGHVKDFASLDISTATIPTQHLGRYVLNHIINYVFVRGGGVVLPCAFTGIAASSLLHGRTAHGTFAIEINPEDGQTIQAKIRPGSKRAKFLASVHAIIWDEMAMMDRAGVEAVDRMLRVVRGCDLPFGGVVFIGCGDFKQLAPVLLGGTPQDIV